MEKIKVRLFTFIKANRTEVVLLSLITITSLLLRLYKIDQFMTFLGDEGRDVRVLRRLLMGDLVFIGPQTSIGNMYLGPLYYYLVAPALALSNLNPVGPAIENAFIGVLAVLLTWYVGRSWFNKWVGLLAALFFAISPVAIIYSRSSWNPNPMPFFSLLAIWGIWQVWKNNKYKYLSIVAISMAFALQMHYLGLLLLPVLGIYWLLTLKSIWNLKTQLSKFIFHSSFGVLEFLILMSPLVLFDLKHNFMNTKAFQVFFSDRQTTVNLNPARSDRFLPILNQVTSDMILSRQDTFTLFFGLAFVILGLYFFVKSKQKAAYGLVLTWLFFGFLGLSVYKQHVYAHYYGFIYPAIYLLLGLIIYNLSQVKTIGKVLALVVLMPLVYLSLKYSPIKESPNNQLKRTHDIVTLMIKESDGLPFNFGLIAKQNYDESYRYFFETENAKMFRGEDKITDQLFVVCEDASPSEASGEGRGDKCQPEGSPVYQIAIFGPSKVIADWNIGGIKIYKLLHSK